LCRTFLKIYTEFYNFTDFSAAASTYSIHGIVPQLFDGMSAISSVRQQSLNRVGVLVYWTFLLVLFAFFSLVET